MFLWKMRIARPSNQPAETEWQRSSIRRRAESSPPGAVLCRKISGRLAVALWSRPHRYASNIKHRVEDEFIHSFEAHHPNKGLTQKRHEGEASSDHFQTGNYPHFQCFNSNSCSSSPLWSPWPLPLLTPRTTLLKRNLQLLPTPLLTPNKKQLPVIQLRLSTKR